MKWRFLILAIALIFGGGMLNYKELNELAIVSSIAIDKSEDSLYEVSVQVMNSKKSSSSGDAGSGGSSQITVYTSKDSTVQAALRKMINESPKKIYLSHLQLLIVSEEIAKDGIEKTLNFFIRNTDINHEVTLMIAKDGNKAKDVISTLTPIEQNPTQNLYGSLKSANIYEGTAANKTVSHVQDEIIKEFCDPSVDSVIVEGNAEDGKETDNIEKSITSTKLLISEIAYFEKDILKGYISLDDSKVYNMLNNKLKNAIIQTQIDNMVAAFEIVSSNFKCKPKMENDELKLDIEGKIKANLTEINGQYKIKTVDELKEVENILKNKIEYMINTYLYNIKNVYKSDISGFGDIFYKKYNLKFKNNSENYLERIKFNVKVETSLENEGGVINQW